MEGSGVEMAKAPRRERHRGVLIDKKLRSERCCRSSRLNPQTLALKPVLDKYQPDWRREASYSTKTSGHRTGGINNNHSVEMRIQQQQQQQPFHDELALHFVFVHVRVRCPYPQHPTQLLHRHTPLGGFLSFPRGHRARRPRFYSAPFSVSDFGG